MAIKAVSEEAFLKPLIGPKPPALSNSDDWPVFSLRKVKVVSQDTEELVSLLSAQKGHPVTVIGQLSEIEENLQHLVRRQNYKKQWIELTDVALYAFAEYLDGTYGFWAAGKAGWFEFDSVSTSYRSIHNQMSEAASWIYILADRIKKQKSKVFATIDGPKVEKYMQAVFSDYLSKAGNPARFSDVEDVRQAFHEHRAFLITCMLECQEGVYWLDTPPFIYFKKHFPEEVAILAARIVPANTSAAAGASEAKTEAMQKLQSGRSDSVNVGDSGSKKRKARPSKDSTSSHLQPPPPKSPLENMVADDEEDDEPVVITRKRKSFLRPSGVKSAKKAKTVSASFKESSTVDEDDDSDDENAEDPSPASREEAVVTIKNGEHLDLITNPRIQSNDHEPQDRPLFLPLKYLELSVAEYDIPSTKPQGPGGLWTCSFDDCRARVHQAATDSGQERVKEHLKTHVVKDRIDLVMDERKPYLPVNNLVRRLQAFAPPSGEGLAPDSIERTFSAPIRRRY